MQGKMSVTYYQGNRFLWQEPVFASPQDVNGSAEIEKQIDLYIEDMVKQEHQAHAEYLGADRVAVEYYGPDGKHRSSKVFPFRR